MKRKVSLDLHDFSVLNNRMDILLKIKEHIPDFKVSLFAIPFDYQAELDPQGKLLRKNSLKVIHDNLDWLQIIPHGLTHMKREMQNVDYYTFRDVVLPAIDEVFMKDGLPYEKGFCPPYWLYNKDVVRVLDEKGWFSATDRNQPDMLKAKRNYIYSHSLEEPYYNSNSPLLKLHGHIDGVSANDLELCYLNLLKLDDAEWHFITDFIDE
jgi:hypothetical protein